MVAKSSWISESIHRLDIQCYNRWMDSLIEGEYATMLRPRRDHLILFVHLSSPVLWQHCGLPPAWWCASPPCSWLAGLAPGR